MANIRLIKRRIKSAQNISQITRAMEMVAASKMKKAQEAALLGKVYAEKIYEAARELASGTDRKIHPLLNLGDPKGKILVILISTNKGLAGGLNTNLFRQLISWFNPNIAAEYVSLGKKGQNFLVKTGRHLIADFSDKPAFLESVGAITKIFVEGFINGSYKEVHLIFNSFINALKQAPTKKMILPLTEFEKGDKSEERFSDFVIEPSVGDVLSSLIPHYLENQLRSAIYEAEASEQSARMIAMKNATDAALDLVSDLTLVYNQARQEKITYEISDMVTARLAVET